MDYRPGDHVQTPHGVALVVEVHNDWLVVSDKQNGRRWVAVEAVYAVED